MKIGPLKKYNKRRGKTEFEPRKITINGEVYWQIHFPRRWDEEKKAYIRKRRTFRDRQEAETVADLARIQKENEGDNSFDIRDDLRRDAKTAARLLEPLGASILEAVRFYARHLEQERASEKVSVAVKEFLAARALDELSRRYLKELKIRLNRFSQSFGERMLATISAAEINTWLRVFKPFNRNTYRAQLSVLFSYAIERGWCQANPVAKVKKVKAVSSPGILSPDEFAKVLEAAGEETLPYWLIGGFAGLRRAEVERLEWKDIHFDSGLVEVPALKAKTASRRFVKIQPNLGDWLGPYKDRTGKLCPANLRKHLEDDRERAGLKKWPSNALRHSFASYHLAMFQNAALLALEMGHTNQGLIFRHYRELVTPKQAEKWWDIRPAAQTNLLAISA